MRFAADYSETLEVFFCHMRFAADYSETLEDPYQECDLDYSSGVHKVPFGVLKNCGAQTN
jgi:hypothetical protein